MIELVRGSKRFSKINTVKGKIKKKSPNEPVSKSPNKSVSKSANKSVSKSANKSVNKSPNK